MIDRAIQKNPDDRFSSTKICRGTVVPGRQFPGKNQRPGVSSQRPARRRRWIGGRRHQLIVALGYWFMVWPTWHVHKWTGRYGVLTFLATLAIVIIGANVRLHLWFTARTYPAELPTQLASISALVRAADVAFSLIMIAHRPRHRRRAHRMERAVRRVRPRRGRSRSW